MQFKSMIETFNLGKKWLKIPVLIPLEEKDKVLKSLHNFIGKPVKITLEVDGQKLQEINNMISDNQRAMIFSILKDYSNFTGNDVEAGEIEAKNLFCEITQRQPFSLSNCSKETAKEFIEWLIESGIKHNFLIKSPRNFYDDVNKFILMSIKYKKCAICGLGKADIHHIEAIGMGRDRGNYDDSNHRVIALCRKHHQEAESIGRESFISKYHFEDIQITVKDIRERGIVI